MPNWTINTIEMSGIGNEPVFSIDEEGRTFFDFNRIVPEPSVIEECAPKYIMSESSHCQPIKGKEWFSWYEWRLENWGTKWNSCENGTCTNKNFVSFWTAWSAPEPIYKRLSRMYPHRIVKTISEYEEGIIIKANYRNGKEVYREERTLHDY